MTAKAQLHFRLRPGASAAALQAGLAAQAPSIRARAPAGTLQTHFVRLEDDPTRQSAHGADMVDAPSFDAVLELRSDETSPAQLAAALEGVGSRVEEWAWLEQSAAVVGTEHEIVPGFEPLRIIFPLRRLPALTPAAFRDYWFNVHAELGRKMPGSQGYRQFHSDVAASGESALAAGVAMSDFEGVAEAYFADVATLISQMSRPEVATVALEDERRFINHATSALGLFRIALDEAPA